MEEASLLDFGEPVELVARDVELLEELLLLREPDLESDLLEALPGDGDRLPDRDLVFFFADSDVRLSLVSVGVDEYPVSFAWLLYLVES